MNEATAKAGYEYEREPFLIVFDESSAIKETYAGAN